ncbi:MAG: sigma-70 family RNA polymerase sigma factor [Phycisphaerales bacterium]|nr:MAG: sigma-70 family RNA polymerase sigma factor [Phycisphaerales bacterium]
MNERTDENLVTACQGGEKAAYTLLVERHYRHVFGMCFGILGNTHDAEDIAQEAMLRGFLKIRKLNAGGQFGPWILKTAKNLCVDFVRRQRRSKPLVAEQHRQAPTDNHDLEKAIQRLPMELRLPLVMYYFGDRNAKIIAEKLGISHSGACQRIRAARRQLHALLSERDTQ